MDEWIESGSEDPNYQRANLNDPHCLSQVQNGNVLGSYKTQTIHPKQPFLNFDFSL